MKPSYHELKKENERLKGRVLVLEQELQQIADLANRNIVEKEHGKIEEIVKETAYHMTPKERKEIKDALHKDVKDVKDF